MKKEYMKERKKENWKWSEWEMGKKEILFKSKERKKKQEKWEKIRKEDIYLLTEKINIKE